MAEDRHDSWVRSALGLDPTSYDGSDGGSDGGPGGGPAPGGVLDSVTGFTKGVGEGLYAGTKDMVVGVYDLGKATVKETYALATDAKERKRVGTAVVHGAQAVGEFTAEALTDPSKAGEKVAHAAHAVAGAAKQIAGKLKDDYAQAAASGNGAEFIGKGVGEAAILIGSFFIPGGGEAKAAALASDAAKAAKAAEAAGDLAKAAKLMDLAKAAEAARVAEAAAAAAKAAEAAKAGQAAAGAGRAAEVGKLAEAAKATEIGKATGAAKAAEAGDVAKGAKAASVVDAAEVEEAVKATKIASRPAATHPPKDYTAIRNANPSEFDGASTFKPKGVPEKQVDAYLTSPEGKALLKSAVTDPAKAERQVARLKSMLMSGAEAAPKIEKCAQPLVKIVPAGKNVGPFSPFFSTPEHLNEALQSGKNLAEFFGLPASSEAASYDVYLIVPKGAQDVVINTVAPTVEFGGAIERGGGAVQHLVVDRSQWSAPKLISHIGN